MFTCLGPGVGRIAAVKSAWLAVGASIAALLIAAPPAMALILPPATIDGRGSDGLALGGVAMASDGTGGLVYTKLDGGVSHVFASRYNGQRWSAPIRVDGDQPLAGSEPRIAAADRGRLLVVWVTAVATVHGETRNGLFSAVMPPGGSAFGPSLLVDPNVGVGTPVDPSVAGTEPGRAIVVYRVVTGDFKVGSSFSPEAELRPGDVMAEVRLARLSGDRWSRIGPVNRNPSASMRPPTRASAPQVAIAADGGAVVAWQEPDESGAARIWARRVFGTTLGPPLAASPVSWNGRPVGGEATALGLDVTPFGQARIAMRVEGDATSALAGPRIFLNTLGPNFQESASRLSGPELADGGSAPPPVGGAGAPSVAASDDGGQGEGSVRVAVATADGVRQTEIGAGRQLEAVGTPPLPAVADGGEAVTAVNPAGGGMVAWPALDSAGHPVVAVRQDFPTGMAQTALLAGATFSPVSGLAIGRAGNGDALIAFRQGTGRGEIIATRVTTPPPSLRVEAPDRWVRPPRARVRWAVPEGAVGGFDYSVLLDGRIIKRGLSRRRYTPPPRLLGSGVRRLQVLAVDRLGEQVLSQALKLRVDDQPPRLKLRAGRGQVAVRLLDPDSGVRARATLCRFGDGSRQRGGPGCHHAYDRPGRYPVVVHARDRAGNAETRRLEVKVR
jgi:hypothetical protein